MTVDEQKVAMGGGVLPHADAALVIDVRAPLKTMDSGRFEVSARIKEVAASTRRPV